jgi:hypothetical protein
MSLITWLLLGLLVLALAWGLVGCVTTGKGAATLVPAPPPQGAEGFAGYFPDLVSREGGLRALTEGASTDRERYRQHLREKLGSRDDADRARTAELSVVARDRTKIPPFLPVDVTIEKQLLGLYLDKDLSPSRKEDLAEMAKARIFNVPDQPSRTALHDVVDGMKRYYFYPRVEVDFSSKLNTPAQLDRFAYLGMVVELIPDQPSDPPGMKLTGACEPVRIIDFQPKAADIVEFSRGELTRKAEAAAKASLAAQGASKLTSGAQAGPGTARSTTGAETSTQATGTPELSLTLTETYVNALKDSIEARTAGLLQGGRSLFADFRAIKNRRIGGTYNFDLMLEVPTRLGVPVTPQGEEPGFYLSVPCAVEVRARAYLVAVVRHVYQRGFAGVWTRVPEPENDKVYLQVVPVHLPDLVLWRHSQVPWVQTTVSRRAEVVVSVITNRADARYVVRSDGADEEVLVAGSGACSEVTVEAPAVAARAHVEFLDVIEPGQNGGQILKAGPSPSFALEPAGGRVSVVGNYGR